MYQDRQVAEQALRVGVSNRMWAIIISRSSCGSSFAYGPEVEASGSLLLKALVILALLRYQTTFPRSSIPLEIGTLAVRYIYAQPLRHAPARFEMGPLVDPPAFLPGGIAVTAGDRGHTWPRWHLAKDRPADQAGQLSNSSSLGLQLAP